MRAAAAAPRALAPGAQQHLAAVRGAVVRAVRQRTSIQNGSASVTRSITGPSTSGGACCILPSASTAESSCRARKAAC